MGRSKTADHKKRSPAKVPAINFDYFDEDYESDFDDQDTAGNNGKQNIIQVLVL